jgi:hypothetical protein
VSTLESNVVPTLTPSHRFLFVNDLTLPLIRMLQRYHTQHLPSLAGDLKTLFPRLAVVVTEEFCKGDGYPQPTNSHPVYVTLYRTLPLETLMHACNPYTSWGSDITVNFFGTYQSNRAKVAEEDTSNRFRYIVGLIIKPINRLADQIPARSGNATPFSLPSDYTPRTLTESTEQPSTGPSAGNTSTEPTEPTPNRQ